ncbi:hypothetical protein F4780DRAFT_196868 [Xylariomycetidae sp. FL0641]|nr:hypothetical protein F4780DRAFT_196868 [Xylariomycetidae sp. FL0641]
MEAAQLFPLLITVTTRTYGRYCAADRDKHNPFAITRVAIHPRPSPRPSPRRPAGQGSTTPWQVHGQSDNDTSAPTLGPRAHSLSRSAGCLASCRHTASPARPFRLREGDTVDVKSRPDRHSAQARAARVRSGTSSVAA